LRATTGWDANRFVSHGAGSSENHVPGVRRTGVKQAFRDNKRIVLVRGHRSLERTERRADTIGLPTAAAKEARLQESEVSRGAAVL